MNKMIALVCLGFAFIVSTPAIAGAQQEKMKGCNKEAKESGLKGEERKAFMNKCLKKEYKLKKAAASKVEENAKGASENKAMAKQTESHDAD